MRIDVYIHQENDAKLDLILEALGVLVEGAQIMSAELDALIAQVKANTEVETGAVTLMTGLAAKILANKNDPAVLTQLAESLKTSAAAVGAALIANTDAAT